MPIKEHTARLAPSHLFTDIGLGISAFGVKYLDNVFPANNAINLADRATLAYQTGDVASTLELIQRSKQQTELANLATNIFTNIGTHPVASTLGAIVGGALAIEQHGVETREGQSTAKTVSELGLTYMARYGISLHAILLTASYINTSVANREIALPSGGEVAIITIAAISFIKSLVSIQDMVRTSKYIRVRPNAKLAKESLTQTQAMDIDQKLIPNKKALLAKDRGDQAIARQNHAISMQNSMLKNEDRLQRQENLGGQVSLPDPHISILHSEPLPEVKYPELPQSIQVRLKSIPTERLKHPTLLARFYRTHLKERNIITSAKVYVKK